MFERSALLPLAAAALLMLAVPAVRANPPPPDHPDEEQDEGKAGGNAIDRTAAAGFADEQPDDYEIDAYFWAFALGLDPEDMEDSEFDSLAEELAYQLSTSGRLWRGEPIVVVGSIRTTMEVTPTPAARPATDAPPEQPIDGPTESILDQIDDRQAQLPMVGEYGTGSTATGAAAPSETPPPESILDYLDSVPPPAAAGEPAKPAINQAMAPQVVDVTQ